MRIVVLGGTRFVGRALVEELVRGGHDVAVVHRGESEPSGWVDVTHIHSDRGELPAVRDQIKVFDPDAAIDTFAMTAADAEAGHRALPEVPTVVLSSMDVYRAYGELLAGRGSQPVPLTEESPVRDERHPYRGRREDMYDYDKLDVEDVYAQRNATIARLPVVFGPHDAQRREDFILARARAERTRIPFGAGAWLWSRVHVEDAAATLRMILESANLEGETLNVAPRSTLTVRQWAEAILDAAGHEAELVRVPDHRLPADLWLTGDIRQHLLATGEKLRDLVGWIDRDPHQAVADSVSWHLAHPPEAIQAFEADDRALTNATER